MIRAGTAILLTFVALPLLAGDLISQDEKLARLTNLHDSTGFQICSQEIRQQFDRSGWMLLHDRYYSDHVKDEDMRIFYMNTTVDDEAEAIKNIAVYCTTNSSGERLVGMEQIEGRYLRAGPTQDLILLTRH